MTDPAAGLEDTVVAQRYRVHEKLGAGGMGVVFRATDTRLRRQVALKRVLLRGLDDDEAAEVRRRTLREAEIAARVHHPRIVSIFDVLDDAGGPLLVLEYLPSRSLGALVADVGVLTPGATARAGTQIAEALAAAHAAGIVHRDVKPGNVLVGLATSGPPDDPLGPVKLADFGISQVTGSASMTATGIGTPAYFAPEIARGETPSPASDVYALGATLRTVVQGTPPFGLPGTNPLELIRRIAQEPVPPPTTGGPLGDLLVRMTAADPDDRPSAAQAAAALAELADRPEPAGSVATSEPGPLPRLDHTPGTADPTYDGTVPDGSPPWYRRRAVLAGAGLAAVLAVGGGVLAAVDGPDGTDPANPTLPAVLPAIAVGDQRTADPCALVDPAALRRYGTPTTEPDYGTFASCGVDVATGPGGAAFGLSASFGPPSSTPPDGEQQRVGDALIVRPAPDSDGCHRYVVLADGTPIDIGADYDGPSPAPADVCAVVETAVASAATALAERGVGRRALPAGRLWSSDACALLTPADLDLLPPDRRRVAVRGFGDWQCQWNEGTDDGYQVTILFDRLTPPSQTGTAAPGSPGFVADDDPDGRCNVEVPNRPYLGTAGKPLTEEIRVKVEAPKPRAVLCEQAVRLAGLANGRI